MAQFRWVNHNQTARQEIDGQHLWSPKTESNGARNEFYNNMRRAAPGDLSYADQAIGYMGRIAEFAFTAPKPMEFGEIKGDDFCRSFGHRFPLRSIPKQQQGVSARRGDIRQSI